MIPIFPILVDDDDDDDKDHLIPVFWIRFGKIPWPEIQRSTIPLANGLAGVIASGIAASSVAMALLDGLCMFACSW